VFCGFDGEWLRNSNKTDRTPESESGVSEPDLGVSRSERREPEPEGGIAGAENRTSKPKRGISE
jgi:hypothetical protein